jgi:glycosyltransferase involved in cell wall biosynthesis
MKVLFVVTAFYPEQAIGSIRITKFVKYLQKNKVDVSVVSLSPPPWSTRDESLYFKGLKNIDWKVIDQSPVFKKVFQKMRIITVGTVPGNAANYSESRNSFKAKFRKFAQFFYTFLKGIDWSIRVKRYAKKYLKNHDYDYIFCSYPSFASPLSGIKLKKLGIGKKLVVDFRDPILEKKTSRLNLRFLIQKHILKNSDLRIFISKGVQKQIDNNFKDLKNIIAPNGFDPKDKTNLQLLDSNKSNSTTLRFVYTGAIYGGKRDLNPFFEAISKIMSDSKNKNYNLSLEYAGKEGNLFLEQAKKFNLSKYVIDHGQLTRSNSLKLQYQSDICLLATWNTRFEQGALTGKIFEYFMFRKPIVAIVMGDLAGSEISKLIKKIGAGFCFEEADPDSFNNLKIWLENAIIKKNTKSQVENHYNDEVNAFDIRQIALNINTKMQEMIDKE